MRQMGRTNRARYLATFLLGYALSGLLTGTWTSVETLMDYFKYKPRILCVESKTKPYFAICPFHKEEDLLVSGSIRDTGIWDSDLTHLLKVALSLYKEAMLVDLGAFIGYFTLYAGALHHDVLAVEPSNSSFKRLRQGLLLNDFSATIKILNKAVSNKRSYVHMGKNQKLNLGKMHVNSEKDTDDRENALKNEMIETVTMNDLLEYIHVKQAIIKIDIEGYECKAMEMSTAFFKEVFVPFIFMEWLIIRTNMNSNETACTWTDAKRLVDYLTGLGYTPFAYHPVFTLLDPSAVLDWEIDNIFWQHKNAKSLLPYINLLRKVGPKYFDKMDQNQV
ncbi:hypothetical protein ACJMK2_037448 [Sinanodonta woodiana]|uniref:Methyltransferase FkbM domain-containing protein n=1 Tax=Sinanodonta woodiana TaxID=1069815 RepID=A0ABD3WM87_SINWO